MSGAGVREFVLGITTGFFDPIGNRCCSASSTASRSGLIGSLAYVLPIVGNCRMPDEHPTPDQPAVWRPIATAPKTGEYLVYVPGNDEGEIQVCQHNGSIRFIGGYFDFDLPPITHWMPLPPPPGEGDGCGDE